MYSLMNKLVFMFGLCGLFSSQVMAHGTDSDQIRHVMMAQFDKPTDRLLVEPVTVQGDYGVASWIQAGKGGRAVLVKEHGKWSILVCGGDGLKHAEALALTGMNMATATALAKNQAIAEAKLSPEALKKFAMFDGIVSVKAGPAPHMHHANVKH